MRDKPYVIGLTGGIASGKTAAAEYLAERGAYHVDADAISRALTAPGGEALPAIRERFGDGVFAPDGTLDRRALGEIVFADDAQRRALEGILHPRVQRAMVEIMRNAASRGEQIVLLNVPLLFETGMDALCDEVWVMALEREEQIERVKARDHLSGEEAARRVDCQMPLEEKKTRANRVVRTNRPVEQTRQELDGLLKDVKKRL